MAWRAITLVVMGACVLSACGGGDDEEEAGTVVYAVGDAADGGGDAAELASYVEKQEPDRFFYLGDVYETGTAAEFERNYDPLYGELADRTDPVIGNHEYPNVENGYYPYWQGKRGWTEAQAKHRSYIDSDSGWQVIAYSSETDAAAEARWVARQIDKQDGTCRIALAHRARYSIADSQHTDNVDQEPVWKVLAGTTAINLAAHSHVYGRLEPIDGVNVIVSGQGGHDIRELGQQQQHQVAASTAGATSVTRFVLRPGEAELTQVDPDGTTYDNETIACERADEQP
jgi:acid phosphatase type 7